MKSLKHLSWFTICTFTILIMISFDAIAIKELDSYGLIFRCLVWIVVAIQAVKGILHGVTFFGDFIENIDPD